MDRSKVEGLVDQETRQCRNVAYFSYESKVSAPLAWFGQLLSADLVTTHITTATTRPQSKNFRTPSSNLDLDFEHHPRASLTHSSCLKPWSPPNSALLNPSITSRKPRASSMKSAADVRRAMRSWKRSSAPVAQTLSPSTNAPSKAL